ncbi:MAG: sulfite exporter TauE/SafE family protein [Deltaproteobacteria bacterium]|nr:sulfite exporter TauE/SafE family protein [Deltaproteobacteria bacterium]
MLLIYVLFGCIVGLFAGLTGAGGAVFLVPILHYTLERQGVDPSLVHHMAIATTMANILFTSSMTTYSHNKRGVVPWNSILWMVPGAFLGSFGGSFSTAYIPARPLILGFGVFLIYAGIQMFVEIKPKASRHMPGKWGQIILGLFVGVFSGLLGIGGVMVSMPILIICGLPILSVIAAAGTLSFPIAVAGCVGYMLTAWGHPDLPPYSLGYVYLPALLGFVPASLVFAPVGVRLTHALPPKIVRKGLGVLVFFVSYRMISGAL